MKRIILAVLLISPAFVIGQNSTPGATNTYQQFKAADRSKGNVSQLLYTRLEDDKKNGGFHQDSINAALEIIRRERLALAAAYIRNNPDSAIVLKVLAVNIIKSDLLDTGINGLASELFSGISERLKDTDSGKAMGDKLEKSRHLLTGAIAPELISKTMDGKPFKLSDYRGKYVLLDFWASWCGPCRKEFPHLKKAYKEFGGKNFEIIGVSVDSERKAWLDAIKKDGANWVHVSTLTGYKDEEVRKYLLQTAVPQNWLIDPQGKIVAVYLRGEEVSRKLAEILN